MSIERVVEMYEDVLENIEAAIVAVHRRTPDLLDYDVDAALEALIAGYGAEQRGRTPAEAHLSGARAHVYGAVRAICEWRLGRQPLDGAAVAERDRKNVEDLLICLKRIRKSVQKFNRAGGRQGYLRFIGQYVR